MATSEDDRWRRTQFVFKKPFSRLRDDWGRDRFLLEEDNPTLELQEEGLSGRAEGPTTWPILLRKTDRLHNLWTFLGKKALMGLLSISPIFCALVRLINSKNVLALCEHEIEKIIHNRASRNWRPRWRDAWIWRSEPSDDEARNERIKTGAPAKDRGKEEPVSVDRKHMNGKCRTADACSSATMRTNVGSRTADEKRWKTFFDRKSSQRPEFVWEEILKTMQRLYQWEMHETLVWFLTTSRVRITKQNRNVNLLRCALFYPQRLTVSPVKNRKKGGRKGPVASLKNSRQLRLRFLGHWGVRVSRTSPQRWLQPMEKSQQVRKHNFQLFVTVQVLEDTLVVLSRRELCEEHADSKEWATGQKPHLTKNEKRIPCKTEKFGHVAVPGLSSSSSSSSSSTSFPQDSSSTSPSPAGLRSDDTYYESSGDRGDHPEIKKSKTEGNNQATRGRLRDLPGGIRKKYRRYRRASTRKHFSCPRFGTSCESGNQEAQYFYFPKDRNCEVCKRTKITRAPCRRWNGETVPRAEKFVDLITADHKVLDEGRENFETTTDT